MNKSKIQIIKDDEIDLRALFQVFWNDRKRIVLITFLVTIIGVIYALIQTPLYQSTISIYPSRVGNTNNLGELKGIASAFGISSGSSQKSLKIGAILSSRSLQKKLIYHEWKSENWNKPVNLITYWGIDAPRSPSISLNPIKWIKSLISLLVSNPDSESDLKYKFEMITINALSHRIEMEKTTTGLYNISVLMEEKDLAADIANVIYDFLVEFNTISHVNKARMNREFIQERLQDIRVELEVAEENLKIFREKNRSILESPQLQLELARLKRDVALQNQLYITLQEQLELIKIKELDEIPTLTVLDKAVPPLTKYQPKRKLIVIMFMLFGGMAAIGFTIISRINH